MSATSTVRSPAPADPVGSDEARRARARTRRRVGMARSIALRLLRLTGVLWLVSVATFSLIVLLPGDPVRAILGQEATDEQVAHLTQELGLDRPMLERYLEWVGGVIRLDFGETLLRPIEPVADVIGRALPVTIQLALMALIIGLIGGLVLGCLAAYRPGSRLDRAISSGSFALVSIPAFVMALLLIRLFVFDAPLVRAIALGLGLAGMAWMVVRRVRLRTRALASWAACAIPGLFGLVVYMLLPSFPREGWVRLGDGVGDNLLHATLPAVTLALGLIPLYAQILRADMIQTLRQSFITVSRSKGMTPRHVVIKEALRPSMFGLITVAGISFGNLVGGSVVVEIIYGLPGLGRLLVTSIQAKDFAVVQAAVLVAAALFLLLNTLVDIAYSLLDPRLRRAGH